MSRISRQTLTGALILLCLTSACGRLTLASPTPVWTVPPSGGSLLATATITAPIPTATTSIPVTPLIPITGENVVSLQCQFCVDAETYAILSFPDFAYFDVSSDTPVSCFTADVTGGSRILICHGAQSATFNLNICSDPSNCLQFPVALQTCSLLQDGATPLTTGTPFYLTPINTLQAPTGTRKPAPTPSSTPGPGGGPATSTPATATSPSYSSGFLAEMGQ